MRVLPILLCLTYFDGSSLMMACGLELFWIWTWCSAWKADIEPCRFARPRLARVCTFGKLVDYSCCIDSSSGFLRLPLPPGCFLRNIGEKLLFCSLRWIDGATSDSWLSSRTFLPFRPCCFE